MTLCMCVCGVHHSVSHLFNYISSVILFEEMDCKGYMLHLWCTVCGMFDVWLWEWLTIKLHSTNIWFTPYMDSYFPM